MKIVMIIICLVLYFLAWLVAHLLCEYKYLWCKGKCEKCKNWRCKFYNGICITYGGCGSDKNNKE